MSDPVRRATRPSTTIALAALGVGIALGSSLHWAENPMLHDAASVIEPVGQIWLNALQMIVVPLVVTQLLLVTSMQARGIGALGAWSLVIFVALLIAGAVFTLLCGPPVIGLVNFDPAMVAELQVDIPEAAQEAAATGDALGLGAWLSGLVSTNLFASLANGDFLQIILITLLFGFATAHLPDEQRTRLTDLYEAAASVTMIIVHWLLWLTPLAVFALALGFSRSAGFGAAGILLAFAAITSVFLLVFTGLLYPAAAIGGRVPVRSFAKSVYRAQVIAAGSRSSLATLPALIEGAEQHLTLPKQVTGFALPFSATTFKVNRTISSTVKLLFLAHIYGIPLSAGTIITFVATVIVLSFTSVGIPRGGTAFKTLPAYLAAGMPLEGVVLLEVIDDIPDIFKTILNSTGYMTVAVLLSRLVGRVDGAPVDALPVPADSDAAVIEAAP